MTEPLWERIKQLICKIFGHKIDLHNTWYYKGKHHSYCKRCRHHFYLPPHKSIRVAKKYDVRNLDSINK